MERKIEISTKNLQNFVNVFACESWGGSIKSAYKGSWQKNSDNTWSYVASNGDSYKGTWIVSNNRWYYVNENGKIETSWTETNGVWYYFSVTGSTENPEGVMLAGTTTPDGYKLDSNGAWVK